MKMHLNWVRFRARHMWKGLEQENTPNMGVSSCSACAEGAKHVEGPVTQKPPKKWVVSVFNVSISVNK